MLETTDKNRLEPLRSRARRNGLRLSKSRRSIGLDNFGGLMLIDNRSNTVVAGSRYDLDLKDAAEWIDAVGGPVGVQYSEGTGSA